jgi:hypothetical protein
MKNTRANTCNQVKCQEFFLSPEIFEDRRCRRHDQHIKKYVKYVGMREHISKKLVGFEKVGFGVPKGYQIGETGNYVLENEYDHVDNDQISNNRCES